MKNIQIEFSFNISEEDFNSKEFQDGLKDMNNKLEISLLEKQMIKDFQSITNFNLMLKIK